VASLRERLRRAMQYKLLSQRQALAALGGRSVFDRMADAIARRQQRVDDLGFRLEQLVGARVGSASRRLDLAVAGLRQRDLRQQLRMRKRELDSRLEALVAASRQFLMRRRSRLEQATGTLAALSPMAILGRGYSLVFDAHGALVKDAAQLAPGDAIAVRLARGGLDARVEALRQNGPGTGKT
jgi:exodeoxyribonuclease VII large subunit